MERILLVDDEIHVLKGYTRHLNEHYDVTGTTSAREALKLLEEAAPFAVVISDLRMPDMDGLTFLSRASKISPQTIQIVITGYATMDVAMQAVNEGNIFLFLSKPLAQKALLEAVQAAAAKHQTMIASEQELRQRIDELLADARRQEAIMEDLRKQRGIFETLVVQQAVRTYQLSTARGQQAVQWAVLVSEELQMDRAASIDLLQRLFWPARDDDGAVSNTADATVDALRSMIQNVLTDADNLPTNFQDFAQRSRITTTDNGELLRACWRSLKRIGGLEEVPADRVGSSGF